MIDFENCTQGIRMNYYPACPEARKVLGLTPHSDATGLTLLVQVNEVQGPQMKKNSKWVPIKPILGSIIVNIGDVLEVINYQKHVV
ncbi:putative codeine 3-O-demethylase [Helianthus annuus]|nr:putative codeine 3-O-demethylase [Helianthus annuus]